MYFLEQGTVDDDATFITIIIFRFIQFTALLLGRSLVTVSKLEVEHNYANVERFC